MDNMNEETKQRLADAGWEETTVEALFGVTDEEISKHIKEIEDDMTEIELALKAMRAKMTVFFEHLQSLTPVPDNAVLLPPIMDTIMTAGASQLMTGFATLEAWLETNMTPATHTQAAATIRLWDSLFIDE
jgi:hypothetical protein